MDGIRFESLESVVGSLQGGPVPLGQVRLGDALLIGDRDHELLRCLDVIHLIECTPEFKTEIFPQLRHRGTRRGFRVNKFEIMRIHSFGGKSGFISFSAFVLMLSYLLPWLDL